MKVYTVTPKHYAGWTEKSLVAAMSGLTEFLKDADIGDEYEILVNEMTEEEYSELPEYTGP